MDFNILHLSDLHIRDTKQLQPNLDKLLSDISEQIVNIREIIVVITGDIVDKGVYNENSQKNVQEFFLKLKKYWISNLNLFLSFLEIMIGYSATHQI